MIRASARMLRAEFPVHRNNTLYGRSVIGFLGRLWKCLHHAGGRSRTQRAEFLTLPHIVRNVRALDDPIALALEEPLRGFGEENQLCDAGCACEPLQILYDDPPQSRSAKFGSDRDRAQEG